MEILKYWDKRVKNFGIIDLKLVQGTTIFLALIVVKLIPDIMNVNIWWFVALFFICVIKPFYVFFIKK
ncbi:MAG: hypothetical protein KAX38_08780 [Candidatus Krumholzibacteria bacterium]|nr:hypothetical protein [Candidatus Krumholzibacteria bacterium]